MKIAVHLAAGLAISCCAQMPAPAPVLTLIDRSCVAEPDLAAANPLVIAVNKAVTVRLDERAPCLERSEGEKSAYVAFLLPEFQDEYLVSVTSSPQGEGLFLPNVDVLDADGRLLRSIPRMALTFHGTSLYVGLRIHSGERYLIIFSDPHSVGQGVSQIVDGTQTNTYAFGGLYFAYNSGSERSVRFTYAHNGQVTVAAVPVPRAW